MVSDGVHISVKWKERNVHRIALISVTLHSNVQVEIGNMSFK